VETTYGQQQGVLAKKNIIFEGKFHDEEKQIIKRKNYSNQLEDKHYSIKLISSTVKKSENLLNTQYYNVSKKIRLLRGMFEEAFTMEVQFDEEILETSISILY
jgi:hypothetical protein